MNKLLVSGLSWVSGLIKGPKIETQHGTLLKEYMNKGFRVGSIVTKKTETRDVTDDNTWYVITKLVETNPRFNQMQGEFEFFQLSKLTSGTSYSSMGFCFKELNLLHPGPTKKSINRFASTKKAK